MGLTKGLEPTKGLLQACPTGKNLQLDSDRVIPFLVPNTPGGWQVLCPGTVVAILRCEQWLTYHLWCSGPASARERASRLHQQARLCAHFLQQQSSEHPSPHTSVCYSKGFYGPDSGARFTVTGVSIRCFLHRMQGCWQSINDSP